MILEKIVFNQNDSKKYIFKSFLKGLLLSLGAIFIITGIKIDHNFYKIFFLLSGGVLILLGIFFGFFIFRESKSFLKDERLKKVHSYAYSYSWNVSLYSTLILLFLEQMDLISWDIEIMLGLILGIMLLSFVVFSVYFDRESL